MQTGYLQQVCTKQTLCKFDFLSKVNLFVSSHEFTLCKSLLILFSISGNEEPKVDIFVSSANMEAWVCLRQFGRSLMYNVKSNGPKLDSRGIPHVILFKCELVSLNYACLHSIT